MRSIALAGLLLLPVAVAVFDIGIIAAAALTLLAIVLLWAQRLRALVSRHEGPAYRLETISMSHFAEKVRWCMDVLGVDYIEDAWAGTLGAYYLGRTVPRLHARTGAVWSRVGNSPEILRFLWGQHGNDEAAAFLEPTPERLSLEKKLDRAGSMLQVWVYYHVLDYPDVTARAWGIEDPAVPRWQRLLIRPLFPIQRALLRRSFRITPANCERAVQYIEELWGDIEMRLADGRHSILGGDTPNYTDYEFAAMTGLWLQPDGYGGDNGDRVRITSYPPDMSKDVERWRQDFPKTVAFTEALYAGRR